MAQTPERKVKQKVVKILEEAGAYYFYPVSGGFGSSGLFDICVVHKGVFIGIECKATEKKPPTKLQSRNAELAKTSRAVVLLLHDTNLNVLNTLLEDISHGESFRPDQRSVWPFEGIAPIS